MDRAVERARRVGRPAAVPRLALVQRGHGRVDRARVRHRDEVRVVGAGAVVLARRVDRERVRELVVVEERGAVALGPLPCRAPKDVDLGLVDGRVREPHRLVEQALGLLPPGVAFVARDDVAFADQEEVPVRGPRVEVVELLREALVRLAPALLQDLLPAVRARPDRHEEQVGLGRVRRHGAALRPVEAPEHDGRHHVHALAVLQVDAFVARLAEDVLRVDVGETLPRNFFHVRVQFYVPIFADPSTLDVDFEVPVLGQVVHVHLRARGRVRERLHRKIASEKSSGALRHPVVADLPFRERLRVARKIFGGALRHPVLADLPFRPERGRVRVGRVRVGDASNVSGLSLRPRRRRRPAAADRPPRLRQDGQVARLASSPRADFGQASAPRHARRDR
mmetsp:Transcript_25191/g.78595  ORF Transcript_25191/g.78595 Transcript_25191/m.78595 type:complete len:395 (-) Transcript_25191:161-1345(-)